MDMLQSMAHSFIDGFLLAIKAIKLCASNPDVIAVHKQIMLPVAGFTIMLYIGIFFATFPLKLIFWILRFDTSRLAGKQTTKSPPDYLFEMLKLKILLFYTGWSGAITSMTPLVVNFILRFIFYRPLDQAYLSVLKGLDPKLAKKLQGMSVRSWREMLYLEIKRMIGMACFMPIYALLSIIPVIGTFLKFSFKVGQFWNRRETDKAAGGIISPPFPSYIHTQIYTLSKWFEPTVAVSLAVVSTFPLTEYAVTVCIQGFFSQMALLQEIQLPYLGRIRVSRREEIKMISRQRMASLGFIIPFNLLLLIPIFGPLFCIVAHAAAPIALKELMSVDTEEAEIVASTASAAAEATSEATAGAAANALVGDADDSKKTK